MLVTDSQHYDLAPAFDILPTGHSLGYQALGVGEKGGESSIENALTAAARYWLTPQEALAEVRRVIKVVAGWRAHFAAQGLADTMLDEMASHIDRPFLKDQRQAFGCRT